MIGTSRLTKRGSTGIYHFFCLLGLYANDVNRVLINGLSNAIKFSKDRPVVIKLSLRALERQIVLEIIDTGDGIPSQSLAKLFKPFVKNDDSVPGAGLGLHISRQLVDSMSGSLDLDSEVGRGTIFRVLLPWNHQGPILQTRLICKRDIVSPAKNGESRLPTVSTTISAASHMDQKDHESPPSTTPELLTPSSSNDTGAQQTPDHLIPSDLTAFTPGHKRPIDRDSSQSVSDKSSQDAQPITEAESAPETPRSLMQVLIVDDNEICRKLLRAGLKRSPIANTVLEAANGQEAVQIYKEKRPDLVITDISMPIMDGVTAAGLMRDADLVPRDASLTARTSRNGDQQNSDPRDVISYKTPARIYALTGLGSSDPRLKDTALTGSPGLDGWLIKGKANMDEINGIMVDMDGKRKKLDDHATTKL